MTNTPVVTVGVDGSGESLNAVTWAASEAQRLGARLRIVSVWHAHAYPGSPFFIAAVPEMVREPGESARAHAEEARLVACRTAPGLDVDLRTPGGPAALTLLGEAEDAAVLVIGGKHHSWLDRSVFGSVTTHAVTQARCPVVVVRGAPVGRSGAGERTGRVVLGFDNSAGAQAAAEYAFAFASGHGLDVKVVEAIHPSPGPGAEQDEGLVELYRGCLVEAMTGLCARYPRVPMTVATAVGHPASVLLENVEGAELLVVGSRGRGWFEGVLLGSVSTALVHQAPVTLAVVHT